MAHLPNKSPVEGHWQQHLTEGLIVSEVSNRSKWLETLLIPALAMFLAGSLVKDDPLLLHAQFPWLWLAPLLVALRYGVLPGLLAGLLLLIEWLICDQLGIYGAENFPRVYFFAGTLLVLLCGEFSDVWRDRLTRIEETNLYLLERLSGLTRRHLLLNLSHDRLEQEMLARPGSLRDALVRLRTAVQESLANPDGLPGTDKLLHLLAQYTNIETAALYLASHENEQSWLGEKVAELGEAHTLTGQDELFQLAMSSGHLAHVAGLDLALERNSNQLVVAPLVTSDGRIVAVLAVSKLPFFSLNVENLQMLSVILAYYADCLSSAPAVREVSEKFPAMPPMFAEEIGRLLRLQQDFHIPSHLAVLKFRGQRHLELPAELMRIKRGLDLYWETEIEQHPAIVVLLPFASASAKEGFLTRIDQWLQTRFGASFETLDVDIRSISFAQKDPLHKLQQVFQA